MKNIWWQGKSEFLRHHCEQFLKYRAKYKVNSFEIIPVFIDWNIGNFFHHQKFELFSRWDYDWFRMSYRMMDFIFLAASYLMPATALFSATGSIP
jgi:hypothetical protein